MVDIAKLQALAAEKGENQTEATAAGGGTFEVPDEGTGGCRLISYIETGKHQKDFKDGSKDIEQVILEFELVGKRWPSTNEETKRERPFIIRITENKSLNEKANFYKLFTRLKQEGDKHMSQLVGRDFKCTVVHYTSGEGNEKKTYANLRDKAGYTIVPPYADVDDGEGNITRKRIAFPEAKSPLKIFLWDFADKEQWDSLFIDGTFADKKDDKGNVIEGSGQSKNWIQARIKAAKNFEGSPIAAVIGGGDALELGDAETPERKATAPDPADDAPLTEEDDPLAGM